LPEPEGQIQSPLSPCSPPDDFYEVFADPETAGEPYYRIKSSRVVKENEIQKT
jgi:hypothetical protein